MKETTKRMDKLIKDRRKKEADGQRKMDQNNKTASDG